MNIMLFSVYDLAVEAFLPPFSSSTIAEATRAFTTAVASPTHKFHESPDDYKLYRLGIMDCETGIVNAHDAPLFLASAGQIANELAARARQLDLETQTSE